MVQAIGAAWFGIAMILVQPACAQDIPPAALPMPSRTPQTIDSSTDTLVAFVKQTGDDANFRQAMATATRQHPRVKEAIAAQREARGVRVEARAGYFPRIDFELLSERSLAREFRLDPENIIERSRPRARTDARIVGEQLLTDFGATSNRAAAADIRVKAAEADVRNVAGDTALRAITAYYEVLAYQALVDLGQAYIARHQDIVEKTRMRFQQGFGSGADVARAEAYAADADNRIQRLARQLDIVRARYLEALGAEAPVRVPRPRPPLPVVDNYEQAVTLSATSPRVEAERSRAAGAEREWRAFRADGLPRVTAALDANQYDLLESGHDYDVRARIVLRQSLFAGGRLRARADQALQRFRQAENIAERVTNEAARDAGIAWRDVESLHRQVGTLETGYIANHRSRDLLVEQFRVARGTLIDLLRAEQEYFDATVTYVQSSVELDLARYVLLERTGKLLDYLNVDLGPASIPVAPGAP